MEECHKPHRILITLKSLSMAFLMAGAVLLLVASCATVQTEPLASGELRLIGMEVSQREELRERLPFVVSVRFAADHNPEILKACFLWSGKGLTCSNIRDVNYGTPGVVRTQIISKGSGRYLLEAYLVYMREGKTQTTNVVGTNIRVFGQ
jgi:hypothetical protein